MSTDPSACLILIGNELLSGRTQDKNLSWLAHKLNETGVQLQEARVIPDNEDVVVATLNEVRTKYRYVFTTGGIGPTHDDITTVCVAKAFDVKVVRNTEAEELLTRHYPPEKLNAARLKMADVPEGAELIPNPVSAAPGYRIENVYVMAGVPRIMQAMLASILPQLEGGAVVHSRFVAAYVTEGDIAAELSTIQTHYPGVEIGSYPFMRDRLGVSLVVRGKDTDEVGTALAEIRLFLTARGEEIIEED